MFRDLLAEEEEAMSTLPVIGWGLLWGAPGASAVTFAVFLLTRL